MAQLLPSQASSSSRLASVQIPCFDIDEIRTPPADAWPDLFERIDEAFGANGPGVLCVTGSAVQEQVRRIRSRLLPQAILLSELPAEVRARLTDPSTPLTNGLSRASESSDSAKTSFYYHPVVDEPAEHLPPGTPLVPLFHEPNRFPSEQELPGFKANAREAAQFVVDVGHALAQLIDRRLEQLPGYVKGSLAAAVGTDASSNHKCRLLRYHPYETWDQLAESDGMWAAPHLDTGSLTGLVPGVFLDADAHPASRPDEDTGLYVLDRNGTALKAELPSGEADVLLYQVGESLQIISGGELQATPHYVRGPGKPDRGGVSRCSLAVFMQPQPHEQLPIPAGMSYEMVAQRSADRHLPPKWPSLGWRFKKLGLGQDDVLTFGQHGAVTFANLAAQREEL